MRDASLQKKKSNQKKEVMNEVPFIMLLMFFLWPALPIFGVACKLLYQLGEVQLVTLAIFLLCMDNSYAGVRCTDIWCCYRLISTWEESTIQSASRPNMVCGFGGRSFPPKGNIHSFKNKKFKFGACIYWSPWDCCYSFAHHSLWSPQSNHFHTYHPFGSFLHTTCQQLWHPRSS